MYDNIEKSGFNAVSAYLLFKKCIENWWKELVLTLKGQISTNSSYIHRNGDWIINKYFVPLYITFSDYRRK